jgi:uncharacterized membrane protein YgcG
MYGEVAFHTTNGTQTLAFERGAVTSASGSRLTVRTANGTEWNWNLTSSSVIRKAARHIPASQLTSGTRVFVGGELTGSARDARLVFVHMKRPAGSRSQWPSGSGSSGSGSSGGSASGSSGASASGAGS